MHIYKESCNWYSCIYCFKIVLKFFILIAANWSLVSHPEPASVERVGRGISRIFFVGGAEGIMTGLKKAAPQCCRGHHTHTHPSLLQRTGFSREQPREDTSHCCLSPAGRGDFPRVLSGGAGGSRGGCSILWGGGLDPKSLPVDTPMWVGY